MKYKVIITTSPHVKSVLTVDKVMRGVIIALIPAIFMSVYFYGLRSVKVLSISILACVLTEVLFQKIRNRPFTILDQSAVVTGLLFALILPPSIPIGAVILGSIFTIIVGKGLFGGLGSNIFNPALLGRAFLMATFPVFMTSWIKPFAADAVSAATPLGLSKFNGIITGYHDLFLGNTAGSLGEASAIAVLIGGIYMLWKGFADWRVPLSMFIAVFISGQAAHIVNPDNPSGLFHLLAGGFMLGALFMATDPVTTPVTKSGRWIFGAGAGILTIVIRVWGGLPEGVMYSILLMNALTPIINRHTRPRCFGSAVKVAA
ncbi:MAG: electron transporter RnfD [Candidatus Omnitrophica bacterium CG1_02_49_10]|nr:MAG: electron transporter RnfD [Candidatus Omnitrophica bacterium CG1_02_49_10]